MTYNVPEGIRVPDHDTEDHVVSCDTTETEVIPGYLIRMAVPEMQAVRTRLHNNLSSPAPNLQKAQNDLLRMEVALIVLDGQLGNAQQERPYHCDYNDEVEGYRDGDTFTWICPQCGREQNTILPTTAELREEDND